LLHGRQEIEPLPIATDAQEKMCLLKFTCPMSMLKKKLRPIAPLLPNSLQENEQELLKRPLMPRVTKNSVRDREQEEEGKHC
jgi:hypothetical protein